MPEGWSEFRVLVPIFDEKNRIASILSGAHDRIIREEQYRNFTGK